MGKMWLSSLIFIESQDFYEHFKEKWCFSLLTLSFIEVEINVAESKHLTPFKWRWVSCFLFLILLTVRGITQGYLESNAKTSVSIFDKIIIIIIIIILKINPNFFQEYSLYPFNIQGCRKKECLKALVGS